MKDLLVKLGKQGKHVLLVGTLTAALAACGHAIDPTMTRLPTYEMPAAVVVQTPPVRLRGATGVGGQPLAAKPHYAPRSRYVKGSTAATASGGSYRNGKYVAGPSAKKLQTVTRSDGSTVIQQSPITVQRPSIVVPQQPIWVGNPPMPIPQPPVVINQPPIVYEQPSVIVRPPQVEFGPPVFGAPAMVAPPVTGVPLQSNNYQQRYQHNYPQQPAVTMVPPAQQRMTTPAVVAPSQPRKEDNLPPK